MPRCGTVRGRNLVLPSPERALRLCPPGVDQESGASEPVGIRERPRKPEVALPGQRRTMERTAAFLCYTASEARADGARGKRSTGIRRSDLL